MGSAFMEDIKNRLIKIKIRKKDFKAVHMTYVLKERKKKFQLSIFADTSHR